MPGGDGTGPMGYGPMTGRGAGLCAGYPAPGYASYGGGRGRGSYGRAFGGRGAFGRGRGYRNMYYATGLPGWVRGGGYGPAAYGAVPYAGVASKEDEVQMLKSHADYFKGALEDITRRLDELESGDQ